MMSFRFSFWMSVLIVIGFSGASRAAAAQPVDVNEQAPYFTAIQTLIDEGIFTLNKQGKFRPDDPINRAEFITALARAREVVTPCSAAFTMYTDVSQKHWLYPYLCAVVREGVYTPQTPPTALQPEKIVTPSEALAMLTKIFDMPPFDASIRALITPFGTSTHYSVTRAELAEMLNRTRAIYRCGKAIKTYFAWEQEVVSTCAGVSRILSVSGRRYQYTLQYPASWIRFPVITAEKTESILFTAKDIQIKFFVGLKGDIPATVEMGGPQSIDQQVKNGRLWLFYYSDTSAPKRFVTITTTDGDLEYRFRMEYSSTLAPATQQAALVIINSLVIPQSRSAMSVSSARSTSSRSSRSTSSRPSVRNRPSLRSLRQQTFSAPATIGEYTLQSSSSASSKQCENIEKEGIRFCYLEYKYLYQHRLGGTVEVQVYKVLEGEGHLEGVLRMERGVEVSLGRWTIWNMDGEAILWKAAAAPSLWIGFDVDGPIDRTTGEIFLTKFFQHSVVHYFLTMYPPQ